jgi:hypothetical protein
MAFELASVKPSNTFVPPNFPLSAGAEVVSSMHLSATFNVILSSRATRRECPLVAVSGRSLP